jgi:riboflavin biosynthesis pyrimidine reductase
LLPALETMFEIDGLPASDLPAALAEAYGSLGLPATCVYANFVSSVDGIVAIPAIRNSPRAVSNDSRADRFVMGLLRAFADVVLVGASTVNASPTARFTADQVFPPGAEVFAQLRQSLGKPSAPETAIMSGSGTVAPDHPAVANGAVVLTSRSGAERLRPLVADASNVVNLGEGAELDGAAIVDALRSRGHGLILSEGGPHALGALLRAAVVDELFLTASPVLIGRTPVDERFGLVEAADLLEQDRGRLLALASVRRHADHLFIRYLLKK